MYIGLAKPIEDWHQTSIFYTYTKCNGRSCKIDIDDGSSLNAASHTVVMKFSLNLEPHPHPYSVAWVDKSNIPITHRCKVPLNFSIYSDQVWCDVLIMDVSHILLGHP